MQHTNVITIQKNIPIPEATGRGLSGKYNFVELVEPGDSFVVNGNTPDITTKAIKCWIYNQRTKGRTAALKARKYTIRTLTGTSIRPLSIRIWRLS